MGRMGDSRTRRLRWGFAAVRSFVVCGKCWARRSVDLMVGEETFVLGQAVQERLGWSQSRCHH